MATFWATVLLLERFCTNFLFLKTVQYGLDPDPERVYRIRDFPKVGTGTGNNCFSITKMKSNNVEDNVVSFLVTSYHNTLGSTCICHH